MRWRRWLLGLGAAAVLSFPATVGIAWLRVALDGDTPSRSIGRVGAGRLEHGHPIPPWGPGHVTYSYLGAALGRQYVHGSVRDTLTAAFAARAAKEPGRTFVLAEGLERLGILPTTAQEALKDEHQFYKRYSLHNVSHMLGLDVHDCAQARTEVYKYGKLQAGMVLTVEPGLYFQTDDLTVPARYRGIGVRIEDDVLVTKTGMKNLSAHIPSSADDVEAWIAGVWGEDGGKTKGAAAKAKGTVAKAKATVMKAKATTVAKAKGTVAKAKGTIGKPGGKAKRR